MAWPKYAALHDRKKPQREAGVYVSALAPGDSSMRWGCGRFKSWRFVTNRSGDAFWYYKENLGDIRTLLVAIYSYPGVEI